MTTGGLGGREDGEPGSQVWEGHSGFGKRLWSAPRPGAAAFTWTQLWDLTPFLSPMTFGQCGLCVLAAFPHGGRREASHFLDARLPRR